MKARVKATGEIIDVYKSCTEDFPWTDEMGDKIWKTEELIFLETTENIPDYWTRLEHQYAGMAMQGMLSGDYGKMIYRAVSSDEQFSNLLTNKAQELAHILVEKMKETV